MIFGEMVATPGEDDDTDRYGSILDQLREGFQVVSHDWRYLYVNDAVVTHGHSDRRTLLGSSMLELYPGIDQTPVFAVMQRCMTQRTSAEFENHFQYPDGQSAWFDLRIYPVPEGIAVLSVDITERKLLEARLRQSQRLDAAGRIAAGLAHDFGNLLTAIQGALALAMSREPGREVQIDLELADGATRKAAHLVEQLLTFSRQRDITPVSLDIRSRAQGFIALLRSAIGRSHPLRMTMQPTPAVQMDPSAFEQVLLNLVVNAADATPGGGEIVVGTGDAVFERDTHVGAVTLTPGRYAVLTVTDPGEGMPPEVMGRIFEPFYTTKPEGQGTGLGLASCYGIVRQAHGAIAVCSEPGRGSTFTVYLPAAETP